MSKIKANNTYTFTVTSVPKREATKKTMVRLMQHDPEVKRDLSKLQTRRRVVLNKTGIRAGRPWVNRVRASKIVRLETGNTFTMNVTPQLVADLRNVEEYLDVKTAK